MQEFHPINAEFGCKRLKADGPVLVLNSKSYVMAEYSDKTGIVNWQRVVLATQKVSIERWLSEHYPVKRTATAAN